MYRANFKELLRIKMIPTSHGFSNIINDQSQNGLYFLRFYSTFAIFYLFNWIKIVTAIANLCVLKFKAIFIQENELK